MNGILMPPSVTLGEEEVAAFAKITARQRGLASKQAAVQQFLKTVVQQGEARLSELQIEAQQLHEDTRKLWVEMKAKHSLDLDRVNYELSDDGKSVAPTAIKL